MSKDSLGDRMKENYENRYCFSLTRRTPVIIRIDGKAFHTLTKHMVRPFDSIITYSMWETAKALCEEIMGCRIAYTQSDEISLLLTDYEKLESQAWFDYNVQKCASVSASLATKAFNTAFSEACMHFTLTGVPNVLEKYSLPKEKVRNTTPEVFKLCYSGAVWNALFDARVFNIPESEVCNYFIWRQQDATRNSIEMLGRCYFSSKELHKVNCSQIQEKLVKEKNVNWNSFPDFFKRGVCVVKSLKENEKRAKWHVDKNIPVFTQDRNYIEQHLPVDDTK